MITPGRNRIGATLRLQASFQDAAGAQSDPTSLIVRVIDQSGTKNNYTLGPSTELIRDSVGAFSLYYKPTQSGLTTIRWEAMTPTGEIVLEDDFVIQASPFYDDKPRDIYRCRI